MTFSHGVTQTSAAFLQQVRPSSLGRYTLETRWRPLSSLRSKPTAVCSSRSSWIEWMLPRPCALWGASTLVRTTALTTTESERRKESMATHQSIRETESLVRTSTNTTTLNATQLYEAP